jgi:hypothetical protein
MAKSISSMNKAQLKQEVSSLRTELNAKSGDIKKHLDKFYTWLTNGSFNAESKIASLEHSLNMMGERCRTLQATVNDGVKALKKEKEKHEHMRNKSLELHHEELNEAHCERQEEIENYIKWEKEMQKELKAAKNTWRYHPYTKELQKKHKEVKATFAAKNRTICKLERQVVQYAEWLTMAGGFKNAMCEYNEQLEENFKE